MPRKFKYLVLLLPVVMLLSLFFPAAAIAQDLRTATQFPFR